MSKSLSIDNALDGNLKPVKDSDGTLSALELSDDKARVKSLEISGEAKGQTPTTGDGLATKQYVDSNAGGTSYWIQQYNMRWYTRYTKWYLPNSTYGLNTENWATTSNTTTLPSTWTDSNNPQLVIPKDCVLKSYNLTGTYNSAETIEFALMNGTYDGSFGSAADWNLTQVGTTQSLVIGTANVQNTIGQTGLSVNLSAGDNLIPYLRRSTTDTSTYYYFKGSFNIVCEVS